LYAAIADWAAVADHAMMVCRRPPNARTIRRLLGRLKVAAVEAALTGWALARRDDAAAARTDGEGGPLAERRCVLAVEGKTPRGACAAP
jgi:hypothetical protein